MRVFCWLGMRNTDFNCERPLIANCESFFPERNYYNHKVHYLCKPYACTEVTPNIKSKIPFNLWVFSGLIQAL